MARRAGVLAPAAATTGERKHNQLTQKQRTTLKPTIAAIKYHNNYNENK